MNACGQFVGKNVMVLCCLECSHFNFFEKTDIRSLCKVEGSRNICKIPLKLFNR